MHITVITPDFTDEEIQAWRLNSLPRASGLGGALTGTQAVRPLGSYHCVFPALLRQHLGILFMCFFFSLRSSQGLGTVGALGLPDKILVKFKRLVY